MTDELKAVVERLTRLENHDGEPWFTATYGFRAPHDVEDDRRMLSLAYIAEHPADDAEPVTADWLLSVGFGQWATLQQGCLSFGKGRIVLIFINAKCDACFSGGIGTGFTWLRRVDARGDVRALCKGLEIDLVAGTDTRGT